MYTGKIDNNETEKYSLYKEISSFLEKNIGIKEKNITSNGYVYNFDTGDLHVSFCIQSVFSKGKYRFAGEIYNKQLSLEKVRDIEEKIGESEHKKEFSKFEYLTKKYNYKSICTNHKELEKILLDLKEIIQMPIESYISQRSKSFMDKENIK